MAAAAIRAVRSETAWQLFSEDEISALEAGKFAETVIWDADPGTVAPDGIKNTKVLKTWMNGNKVCAA